MPEQRLTLGLLLVAVGMPGQGKEVVIWWQRAGAGVSARRSSLSTLTQTEENEPGAADHAAAIIEARLALQLVSARLSLAWKTGLPCAAAWCHTCIEAAPPGHLLHSRCHFRVFFLLFSPFLGFPRDGAFLSVTPML